MAKKINNKPKIVYTQPEAPKVPERKSYAKDAIFVLEMEVGQRENPFDAMAALMRLPISNAEILYEGTVVKSFSYDVEVGRTILLELVATREISFPVPPTVKVDKVQITRKPIAQA